MPKRTLSDKMDEVMENHIPHLFTGLELVKDRLKWLALAMVLGLLVVALVPDTAPLWRMILGR